MLLLLCCLLFAQAAHRCCLLFAQAAHRCCLLFAQAAHRWRWLFAQAAHRRLTRGIHVSTLEQSPESRRYGCEPTGCSRGVRAG